MKSKMMKVKWPNEDDDDGRTRKKRSNRSQKETCWKLLLGSTLPTVSYIDRSHEASDILYVLCMKEDFAKASVLCYTHCRFV